LDELSQRVRVQGVAERVAERQGRLHAHLNGLIPWRTGERTQPEDAMDLRAELARITAPTLLIAGAQDPVTPPAKVLETQQLIAGSAMVVIPHAAHLANIEQPAPFTDALLNHLAGPPASRGESVRRAVLGDAHVNRSSAQANAFNSGFLDMITSYAWGEIWTRPGLDRKTRSAITLAVLTALGHHGELELHLRGAIRNGWSEDEIAEMLMHTAVYAGVPAANAAFAVAKRVLAEDPADW
jgi:3-oxoadipate enol-lactonase/4-carboxymuconolactone decarboxylase